MKSSVDHVDCSDGYSVAVRRWTPEDSIACQLVILHGVVSHSEWLDPFGIRLARAGIEVICPDRRGTGLNNVASGDAPSKAAIVEDVHAVQQKYCQNDRKMHLAGFCWGAVHAICCAEADEDAWASLLLLAPSVFPTADMAEKELVCGDSSDATELPLVPIDRFTSGPAYEDYIIPDPLRTRAVSRRFNSIMRDMSTLLPARWARLSLPTLLVLASNDSLVDNKKHEAAFAALRASNKKLSKIDGEHGLQFEAPDKTCNEIGNWLHSLA